ncbi:ferredoxin [Curtobacterium flaccumfaciens]|nr:ferredoxin [Curtobacterium flaccumfaciens]
MTAPHAAQALHVDWTRCRGRGLCTELFAERLARDEWGYPVVRDGGGTRDVPVPRTSSTRRGTRWRCARCRRCG